MKIKKPIAVASPVNAGGAAIADRFRLDAAPAAAAPQGKGPLFALIAGVLALIVAGALAFTLWQHWEVLMPA